MTKLFCDRIILNTLRNLESMLLNDFVTHDFVKPLKAPVVEQHK